MDTDHVATRSCSLTMMASRRVDEGRHAGCTIRTNAPPEAVQIAPPAAAPCSVLSLAMGHGTGTDLAHLIAAQLGWRELVALGSANRYYRDIATSELLWEPHCSTFWADKLFVPAKCKKLVRLGQHRKAFSEAIVDSARTWITAEELCSLEWHGRMKEAAGEHFTETDPWWTGATPKPASRYHMDGTTTRWTRPERSGDPLVETTSGEWRFVRSTCGQTGPLGSFIRMKHRGLGRETPTKIIKRHKNWGFVLDGCWSVSASFPLPPKGEDSSLEDDALPVTVETQQEEAMAYNYGLPMPDDRVEGGASGGEEGGASGSDASAQMVTIEIGGREVTLPVHTLVELVRQNQLQASGSDSESSDDDEADGDIALDGSSSPSEEDEDNGNDSEGTAAMLSSPA
jgi:hypothetical protein